MVRIFVVMVVVLIMVFVMMKVDWCVICFG